MDLHVEVKFMLLQLQKANGKTQKQPSKTFLIKIIPLYRISIDGFLTINSI